MLIETLIRSWKDPEFRATLGAGAQRQHPSGDHLLELDEAVLQSVVGASSGYVCTLSGECSNGCSCWSLQTWSGGCNCLKQ